MLLSVYADVIAPEDSTVAVEEVPDPTADGAYLYSLLLLMRGNPSVPVFRLDGLSRGLLEGLRGQIDRALNASPKKEPIGV